MRPLPLLVAACLVLSPALPASAQDGNAMDHSGMDHSGHGMATSDSPATRALKAANAEMHAAMDVPYTGNADVDFVAGMIPHHQGAVDMAKVALEYGSDPEIRKLAEEIIAAQETEIAFMRAWLEKNAE